MRLSAALLAAMLALCGTLAAGAAAARDSGPRLAIVRAAPLTVHGTGFAATERVRLTVRTTTRTVARSVRAGTGGEFTVRFVGVRIAGRCGEAAITAVGARGDRARLVRHRGIASCNAG
jgi:hypothetical protein